MIFLKTLLKGLLVTGIAINLFVFARGIVKVNTEIFGTIDKLLFNWEISENNDNKWIAKPSRTAAEGKTKYGIYDYTSHLLKKYKETKSCFGFQVDFLLSGYNYIDVYPEKKLPQFEGSIKSLSIWVWGGGYDYTLDILLKDYQDYLWTLPMGSLKYNGWKNLSIDIPISIPRESYYYPKENLEFSKFRFHSAPTEFRNQFNCFIDYFKITTDISSELFDGSELNDVIEKSSL